MGLALSRLAQEDPSFRVKSDEESGQTVIAGMGELHLDIIVDRMKREFKVEANVGAPQVAYRETFTKVTDVDYTHKKQSGGSGQFARVKMTIEPMEPGGGYEFENKIVGGAIPKEYIPGVEKGIESVRENGVLAGFPMIDFRVTLHMGDVIGDLNSRRGQVRGTEARGNASVITAMVPLANMFGYVNTLRSMTQGRAQYSMLFDHYEPVPQAVSDEVIAKMA